MTTTESSVRWGAFEIDRTTLELRQDGRPVKLGPQPVRLLLGLIDRRGELVTREELYRLLWPQCEVDVERGLNTCIRQVRAALGEPADGSLIRTYPRRGYRFVGDVEVPATHPPPPAARPRSKRASSRWRVSVALVLLSLLSPSVRDSGTRRRQPRAAVVEDYRAALYLLARPERRAESMAHLLRVTAGDPEFAAGHAHLAEALFWAQRLEPARAAARRALELDHRSARAHFLLGNVLLFADRDWVGARVALERALELAPQDAELRTGYAFLLAAQGEAGRARTQVRRALEQDMVTASVLADAGAILRWSGDPDGARGACARALELEPELTWAADCVARLQVERGQDVDRKALAHLVRQAGEEPPAVLATGPDRTTLAQTWRAWELNRLERAHASPEIWYRRALAYADAGRRDAALAALERAVAGRARSVLTLAVEPRLAGLRSEPRFRALVAVLGLTPASPAPIF